MKMAIDVQRLSGDTRREVKSGGLGQDLTLNTLIPHLFVQFHGFPVSLLRPYWGLSAYRIFG